MAGAVDGEAMLRRLGHHSKDPKCEGVERMILPVVSGEFDFHTAPRCIIAGLFLGWFFMGVGIISDIFMGAIEKITAKKIRVRGKNGRLVTVKLWNDTMSNLTLMALGSSAPEILINVIEVLKYKFKSGDLGPSTIVGSAAFNLLLISAVCIAGVDEVKKINDTTVFAVTAAFSIFAYTWMIIVLVWNTENIVELHEAILTLAFMAVMLILAFLADKGYFSSKSSTDENTGERMVYPRASAIAAGELSKEELAELSMAVRSSHGHNLTDTEVALLVDRIYRPPPTKATYAVMARRNLFSGKKPVLPPKEGGGVNAAQFAQDDQKEVEDHKKAIVEFGAARYHVVESMGRVTIGVVRSGNLDRTSYVSYRCKEGTAKEQEDYIPIAGELTFEPGEEKKDLHISIVDDKAYENDEDFFVELYEPHSADGGTCAIGALNPVTVIIIDDDDPGVLLFEQESIKVEESSTERVVNFRVERRNGANGKVGCKFHTEDGSAKDGVDFEATEGTVEFEPGQTTAEIGITIKSSRGRYLAKEFFRIYLTEPSGNPPARFDAETDGGENSCVLTVTLQSNDQGRSQIDMLQSRVSTTWERSKIGHAHWADQFTSAVWPNGGREESKDASIGDWATHIVALPWKLLFAFVPPVDYCDGWVCFFGSLAVIAFVTAWIGDLASLFGCLLGVPEQITAITFVALGTSLPDTFASKMAAQEDEYADASVGNITGSNSVNVFLGLGLPWVMASIHWKIKGEDFIVEAKSLAKSVYTFTVCAFLCLLILAARRFKHGGELGGPKLSKYLSALLLVLLWIGYLAVASYFFMEEMHENAH